MRSALRQIRDAAEEAERAAQTCLMVEAGRRGDARTIAAWQDVASMLEHAARPLADPSDRGRWYWSNGWINVVLQVLGLVVLLLWVPDPGRPLVLAAIVVGVNVPGLVATELVAGVRTTRIARRWAAGVPAWDPAAEIDGLRSRIAAIRVALTGRLSPSALEAAQRIEWASARLDRLEHHLESPE